MPKTAESPSGKTLTSWRAPATRLDWFVLGVTGAHWLYRQLRDRHARNRDTVLKFSPDDPPYYWLLRWLENMPRDKELSVFRVMMPSTGREGEAGMASTVCAREPRNNLPVLVPTEGVCFTFRGAKCSIERADSSPRQNDQWGRRAADLSLKIESRDTEITLALLQAISEAGVSKKEQPKVYVFQWNWIAVRACPLGRAAILPKGDYASISNDLRQFFTAEEWYHEVGLPYRRGYLLEGIAGGGKTTTVIALAGDFGYNVCMISLVGHSDNSLLEAIRSLPSNSFLLLEDVDCAFDDRKGKDDSKLTFSGLLNVLDGAATPEGRVTFMTTNHREKLDPALIRPGRVDKKMEFGPANYDQIEELTRRFSRKGTGEIPLEEWASEKISMADVQERLIQVYRHRAVPGPIAA